MYLSTILEDVKIKEPQILIITNRYIRIFYTLSNDYPTMYKSAVYNILEKKNNIYIVLLVVVHKSSIQSIRVHGNRQ